MDRHSNALHARRRGAAKPLWLALLLATPVAWAQTRLEVFLDVPFLHVGVDTLGDLRPPQLGPHQGSHGSTIVVDAHGLLVVEREEGMVVRAVGGEPIAELQLAPGLGEIVRDETSNRVFVAERGGDRLLELTPGDAHGRGLGIRASLAIREPHGLALTPDGHTLLVTSVADHELVGVDLRDGELTIAWRASLAPEPRGVAVSPDGKRAIIGFLSSGAVALVSLPAHEGELPRVRYRSLEPRDQLRIEVEEFEDEGFTETSSSLVEARSRFEVPSDTGRRSARNMFAVAFVGHGVAVTPHELATPQLTRKPQNTGTYGGGESFSPITHTLSMLGGETLDAAAATAALTQAEIFVHMPRSLGYDLARDTLYVGGYGDDAVQAIADVSQQSVHTAWRLDVANGSPCGIDGLAVDGDNLWVHCEFGRKLLRVELGGIGEEQLDHKLAVNHGSELTKPIRAPEVEKGAELFRRAGDERLTLDGSLACAQCHPEGRSDGLSWRLEGAILQTPMLAGRLVGTAPFKWDGQDPDLATSLHATIGRLGGHPDSMKSAELHALRAYLESLPAPRSPTPSDADAIARGREVFESSEAACDACHEGSRLTDRSQHTFATALAQVDTPSLLGLAHSAPYYHDGSAVSLEALLANRTTIHDMADTSKLTPEQFADLGAYLESL